MNVDHIANVVENLPPEQALDAVLAARESMRFCLTSSLQAEDMAVLHMLRKRIPDVPALFLDTGYHFPQNYEYRDRMTKLWSQRLLRVLPSRTAPGQGPAGCSRYRTGRTRRHPVRWVAPR